MQVEVQPSPPARSSARVSRPPGATSAFVNIARKGQPATSTSYTWQFSRPSRLLADSSLCTAEREKEKGQQEMSALVPSTSPPEQQSIRLARAQQMLAHCGAAEEKGKRQGMAEIWEGMTQSCWGGGGGAAPHSLRRG